MYPPAPAVPNNPSSNPFDDMVRKMYVDSTSKLRNALASVPCAPSSKRECQDSLRHLRIWRHLFMHAYIHLMSCHNGRDLYLLVSQARVWKEWNSVQQLAHHALIRKQIIALAQKYPCRRHQSLFVHIADDDNDLLCHLLYCRRKTELYELHLRENGEAAQVIELIWEFLKKRQSSEIVSRLRSQLCRMARKSAYLPSDLQIMPSAVSSEKFHSNGAKGTLNRAVVKDRQVIIKRIKCANDVNQRKCLEMFASEAILWKTMYHKNIVAFIGILTTDSGIGLVSHFYENGSIRKYMKGPDFKYSSALARTWTRDLAEALEYIHCHEPPIIHGDLKGDNVLVDDAGHARLGDFGQSHTSDTGKYLDSTRVGLASHNPMCWMAPEIIMGGDHAKATDKSDVYSFGCVLFEIMSCGGIPYGGCDTSGDVIKCITTGKLPTKPSRIDENDPLWELAKWCWVRPASNRPSATQLAHHYLH